MPARFFPADELRILRRQPGHRRALRGDLLVVSRELQHAAAIVLHAGQALPVGQRIQERRPRQAREDAVVGREHRMKGARVIAGCLLRRLRVPLVELHLPAARAQALAYRRARDTGADHHRASGRWGKMATVTIFPADEHFTLAGEAGALLHRKARRLQRLAHRGGDAPGGEGRARRRQPRERAHRLVRPHLRVLRRREAVEIDRIRACPHLPEHRDVAKEKRQHHIAKLQPMRAGNERRPSGVQRARFLLQLRIAVMQRAQLGKRERVLFHRDEMQPPAAVRIFLPRAPSDEEVQPEAEPRLEDDVALAPRPARGQLVAGEEHMPRLRRPAARAVIDVAVGRRIRRVVA